ncbi:purine-nucleoside phosphorylase [Leucobacter rhizosphaerae]|uniref:Purine-nucleoside phosphorylase n=1 Tax=Leucobacter rhizosphaerae TaxID=2932245 RepID=A0ABY4FZA8_9MICO|nr:purine-nucleoside phosphorylase [Leucobacter rhizosphaerae]UOQ61602.1 purine-nucleoside phosphorylase [Leucobacter rhizosphaerae]
MPSNPTAFVPNLPAPTLLVFAHRDEATAFADVPHLVTGVGKVNAASSLAGALAAGDVARVVVLGTAGVVGDGEDRLDLDTVYQVTGVVQHDFSLPSPELRPAGDVVLPDRTATLATGDVFVKDDAQRTHIQGLGAGLVDMEAYAYAAICERFDVPLQLFKIPSDFADSSTTDEEWDTIVFRKSEQLREFWEKRLA